VGLKAASLKCDSCGHVHVLSGEPRWSASEIARDARARGWERMARAWLCKGCVERFARLEAAWREMQRGRRR
jgi:hypothetical protein